MYGISEQHEYRNVYKKLLHENGTKSDPAKGNQLKRNSKLRQKSDPNKNCLESNHFSINQHLQLTVCVEADLLLSEY